MQHRHSELTPLKDKSLPALKQHTKYTPSTVQRDTAYLTNRLGSFSYNMLYTVKFISILHFSTEFNILGVSGFRFQQEYFHTFDENSCLAELNEHMSAVQGATASVGLQHGTN